MIATLFTTLLLSSGVSHAGKTDCDRSEASQAEVSMRLRTLYEAEAADAANVTADKAERDKARTKEVLKTLKKGLVCSAEDQFYASWVIRHSTDVDTLQTAYDLAVASMKGHIDRSNWLTATTFDRLQVYSGFPQRYGSMIGHEKGVVCLYEIDPTVTDEDRAQYRMPPIADQYQKVLLASKVTEPPTLREVKRRGLICPGIEL